MVRREGQATRDRCEQLESELARQLEHMEEISKDHRQMQERYDELYLKNGTDGALKVEVD